MWWARRSRLRGRLIPGRGEFNGEAGAARGRGHAADGGDGAAGGSVGEHGRLAGAAQRVEGLDGLTGADERFGGAARGTVQGDTQPLGGRQRFDPRYA